MNSHRLHVLMKRVQQETTRTVPILKRLADEAGKSRPITTDELVRATLLAPSYSERQALVEAGVLHAVGDQLAIEVMRIAERKPREAAARLVALVAEVDAVRLQSKHLVDAFRFFNIMPEPDRYALGFRPPPGRPASATADDLKVLAKMVEALHQWRTGESTQVQIVSTSNSDLWLWLDADAEDLKYVADWVLQVLKLSTAVLKLREVVASMRKSGIDPAELGIQDVEVDDQAPRKEDKAERFMQTMPDAAVDTGRKNELKVLIVKGLRRLAERIDAGGSVDVQIPQDRTLASATSHAELEDAMVKLSRLSVDLHHEQQRVETREARRIEGES